MKNKIEWDQELGLYLRPDTWDANIVAEQRHYKLLNIVSGSVVLDLGAHIGSFALWAFKQGALIVYSFEPDQENFSILYQNWESSIHRNVWVIQNVAVSTKAEWKVLYRIVNNTGMHTLIQPRKYAETSGILTASFENVLDAVPSPTHIKIDIEGEERNLNTAILSKLDKCSLAIEYHLQDEEGLRDCIVCHQVLQSAGFNLVKDPDFTHAHQTIGIYRK